MSQYKKRRRMFPFTPHTTLRPDYCSGGSFCASFCAVGAPHYLLGTGLRLFAPEGRSALPCSFFLLPSCFDAVVLALTC